MTRAAAHESDLAAHPPLRARRLGIHTQHEAVVFMRTDCPVCRSEGLSAHAQIVVAAGEREVVADREGGVGHAAILAAPRGPVHAGWSRTPRSRGAGRYITVTIELLPMPIGH